MNNELKEIIELSDKEVSILISILKKSVSIFPSMYVPTELMQQGFTLYKGIIIPIKDVEHNFIFDYYEKAFLETVILFLERMWMEKESQTNVFGFRALLEMSIEDSFVIFNSSVAKEDKKLFLLIIALADFASINTPLSQGFYGWFEKIFVENEKILKSELSKDDYKNLRKVRSSLLANNSDAILIKNLRRILSPMKGRILDKVRKKGTFNKTKNYVGLSSGWSHILHGNIFLIQSSLNKNNNLNHIMRVYAHIFIAGISVLEQVVPYHNNKELTDFFNEYKKQHSHFRIIFERVWKNLKV